MIFKKLPKSKILYDQSISMMAAVYCQ